MALVHIDLSELDALRDNLKEARLEKEKLQKDILELKAKHSAEIKDLKNGALVIERTPVHEIQPGLNMDSKTLTNKVMQCLNIYQNNRSTTQDFSGYLEAELKYLINGSRYQLTNHQPKQMSVIEKITGYSEVEREIREYYTKQHEAIINQYKETIKNSEKLEKELNEKYFFNVQDFEKNQLVKTNELIKEHNEALEKIIKGYTAKIKELEDSHKLTLENMKPVNLKLDEALAALGFKIEKGNWFLKDRLVKL